MDGLETVYLDDGTADTFIECNICNKSIRGETLYKIHLTTIQHVKREDNLVASGQATRDHVVPDFTDIKEYLKYLDLPEPIIGLGLLNEEDVFTSDPQPGPKYVCQLCDLHANLPNMVNHIVGRRHRQKYLEVKRKDLVTWDPRSSLAQPGKVIKAKAEIVERQDGQGFPKPLRTNRNVGKLNISKVPQKHERLGSRGEMQEDQAPLGLDYPGEYPHRGGHPEGDPYRPPFQKDYQEEDLRRQEFFHKDHRRVDQRDRQDYSQDFRRRDFLGAEDQRTSHPEEIPQHEAYPEDHYSNEAVHRRAFPENDPLKQFYSEEVLRGRARSVEAPRARAFLEDDSHGHAYPEENPAQSYFEDEHGRGYAEDATHRRANPEAPYSESANRRGFIKEQSNRGYPEGQTDELAPQPDPRRRALDRDPNGKGYSKESLWQAGGDRAAGRNRLAMEERGQHTGDHLLNLVKAIREEGRGKGLEAGRAPPPQRPAEGSRVRSEIPEPFRQFLSGALGGAKYPEKRKKKSRFSDATEQEMDVLNRTHTGDYKRPRQETYDQPQGVYQGSSSREMPQEQIPDTGNVLDVLNNIQIENVEEANFLKDKLCNLLKEFQANKSEKAAHNSQGPATVSKDYNHVSKEHQESTRDQYERQFSQAPEERNYESQPRQSPKVYNPETTRGPYRERPREAEEQLEKHSHATRSEPSGSRRAHYEKVFGQVNRYPSSQDWQEEPRNPERSQGSMYPERSQGSMYPERSQGSMFPERSQGSMHPGGYPELYDPYQPTPAAREDWRYGRPPGPHTSTSLDKITSTLLELVARKS